MVADDKLLSASDDPINKILEAAGITNLKPNAAFIDVDAAVRELAKLMIGIDEIRLATVR